MHTNRRADSGGVGSAFAVALEGDALGAPPLDAIIVIHIQRAQAAPQAVWFKL